jgi:hypothetical protein
MSPRSSHIDLDLNDLQGTKMTATITALVHLTWQLKVRLFIGMNLMRLAIWVMRAEIDIEEVV